MRRNCQTSGCKITLLLESLGCVELLLMPVKHRSVHSAGSIKAQLVGSKPPAQIASYPVHARAFAGFAPVVQSTGKEPARNIARYNPNWGESLIAAVLQDSAALCIEALADDCADVNTLVAGGSGGGAPF
eukprot:18559-Heterococcus_DN1.PRE.2